MIVRDIVNNPSMPFDYFNDYRDTSNWLKKLEPDAKVVHALAVLSVGYETFIKWRCKMDAVRLIERAVRTLELQKEHLDGNTLAMLSNVNTIDLLELALRTIKDTPVKSLPTS